MHVIFFQKDRNYKKYTKVKDVAEEILTLYTNQTLQQLKVQNYSV